MRRSQPAFFKRLASVAEGKWLPEDRFPAKGLEARTATVGGPRRHAEDVLAGLSERVRWRAPQPPKLRFFRLCKLVEAAPPAPAELVAYRALADHLQKLRHERRL